MNKICKNCRYWDAHVKNVKLEKESMGLCLTLWNNCFSLIPYDNGRRRVFESIAMSIHTKESFGCNQWEESK